MDLDILRNSLATSAAYAVAIDAGLTQWRNGEAIRQRVRGIEAPTLTRSGGDPDGCCRVAKPSAEPTLEGAEQLVAAVHNLARYLEMLSQQV